MKRIGWIAWLCVVGCGSSTPPEPETMTVGIAGGVVATDDGSAVEVPSGAVTEEIVISITPMAEPAPPSETVVVGPGYLFEPEGATFSTPVKIVLAVDPAKLPSGKTLADVRVFTAPGGSTTYTALPTLVVDATHVSATTTHFSTFVPAVAEPVAPTCMGTCMKNLNASCTCTALCGDVSYSMTCYDGEGCVCGLPDTGRFLTVTPRCNDGAGLASAWSTAMGPTGCGYPGTVTLP